ncbi:hypothetical protein ACWCSH_30705, partial [Streptosporangium sp. NPDC001682]
MPWNMGSPLASTHTRRPRWGAISRGRAGSSGEGQTTRSALGSGAKLGIHHDNPGARLINLT